MNVAGFVGRFVFDHNQHARFHQVFFVGGCLSHTPFHNPLMVLGEHGFQSGEGRSRTNLDLPGVQQELLEEVYKVNPNIVLVLNNGRPLALPWAAEHIPAIVEAWHLGTQTGNAVAQVLYGDYNPSGKLPMSFPRNVGQVPIYYNNYNTGRPVNSDKNVFWSHYTDVEKTP